MGSDCHQVGRLISLTHTASFRARLGQCAELSLSLRQPESFQKNAHEYGPLSPAMNLADWFPLGASVFWSLLSGLYLKLVLVSQFSF